MVKQQQVQKKALSQSAPKSDLTFLQTRPFAPSSLTEALKDQEKAPIIQTQVEHSSWLSHNFGNLQIQPVALATVQAKLTIGQPGDKYEQEADQVAQEVVGRIHAPKTSELTARQAIQRQGKPEENELQMKPIIQRQPGVEGIDASAGFESNINQARGGGQSLATSIRQPMEQAFGADFSGVRIHTDGQSDKLSRSIQAKAFTTGQDVFFKQGAYDPGSRSGQELIAHELTHVVQQNGVSTLQPKIQRTQEDQKLDILHPALNYASFKSATYLVTSKRGEYLETIDKWLKAVDSASTWDNQQYALTQVADACNSWLDKHGHVSNKKEPSSVTHRRLAVLCTLQLSTNSVASSTNSQTTAPAIKGTRHTGGRIIEMGEGVTESLGNIGGGAGDFDDVNGTEVGDSIKSDAFDAVNSVGGIKTTWDAVKGFREADGTRKKIEAGGNVAKGLGQTSHGVMKAVKAGGGSDNVGELGAVIGDSTTAFAGAISTVNNFIDLCADWKESTWKEKTASALEIAGNATSTGQAGVKTALGVMKTSAAFAGGEVASQTVSALGSAAAILGIITGSIQIAQGGFQIYRAFSAKNQIKEAEAKQEEIILTIGNNLQLAKKELPALFDAGNREEILKVGVELRKLRDTLEQLQEAQMQAKPAMEALKKIQNRRMEEGAMKTAGGTLSIVSSSLVLSGVGAPIGIAIGALGGLLALGYAGVNLARNAKAGTLTTIAKRLSDDGKPKAKPDPQEPSYRAMEGRIYKCYYNHLPHVIEEKQPAGMSSSEFTHVKEFTWEDKKQRVPSLEKAIIYTAAEAAQLKESTKKNKWVEVHDSNGQATHKEKPKGFAKVEYMLSASAHKSKQSLQASKDELATILTALCVQSYDSTKKQFINSPIKPMGEADPDTLREFGNITLKTLLSAADITEARWSGWFSDPQVAGDEAKLKQKVLAHIS